MLCAVNLFESKRFRAASIALAVWMGMSVLTMADRPDTSSSQRQFNPYRTQRHRVIETETINRVLGRSVLVEEESEADRRRSSQTATEALFSDHPEPSENVFSVSELNKPAFLPPTTGQFVRLEHRWVFVPRKPDRMMMVKTKPQSNDLFSRTIPSNRFRTASAIEDLRSSTHPIVILAPENPLREAGSDERFLLGKVGQSRTVFAPLPMRRLMVTDNLVLRRTATHLQANNRAYWIVTGQVTRQDDEAFLELRTVKREVR